VRHPGGKRVFFALAHLEDLSAAAILRIGSETTQTGVDATTAVAAQGVGPVRAAQPPPCEPSHFIEVVPTIRRSGWSASISHSRKPQTCRKMERDVSQMLAVSPSTIVDWKTRQPEFAEALRFRDEHGTFADDRAKRSTNLGHDARAGAAAISGGAARRTN
jgi:hypothetical protein